MKVKGTQKNGLNKIEFRVIFSLFYEHFPYRILTTSFPNDFATYQLQPASIPAQRAIFRISSE